MIGIASVSKRSTIGASVPLGNSARTAPTLSRTSCVPTSPFFDNKNRTVTTEIPSELTDWMASTPDTVLMASSITFVTVVSVSSALAPGSVVVMAQTGKSTLGNRSTPMRM